MSATTTSPDPIPAAVDDAGEQPPAARANRSSILIAIFLVAAIGGAALFVSGFALGRLAGATPGTGADQQELFRPFWNAFDDVTRNYVGEYDPNELVQGAIDGVFNALGDPFSQYMTEEEYRASLTGLSGQFEGVGIEMTIRDASGAPCEAVVDTCQVVVTGVIRGSPAVAAGLQEGDVLVAVDAVPTSGKTIEEIVSTVRGPRGTDVVLTVGRDGAEQNFTVTRDVIQREDVHSEVLADGRIGYIKIDGFSAASAEDLRATLTELLQEDGVEALVLDLRDDPGGYVDAAQKIASEFVGDRPLYYEQTASGEPMPQQPTPGGVATDPSVPVVVLVNGGTASASEIVAAALQGNDRARLVGSTTYGKATIQEFKELPGAGGYRLSVRKWLTPELEWVHGVGLTPDVEVEALADQQTGEDAVLDRAIEILLEDLGDPAA